MIEFKDYWRKPTKIQSIQLNKNNFEEIKKRFADLFECPLMSLRGMFCGYWLMKTNEGTKIIREGDYIINKGGDGIDVMEKKEFENKYEGGWGDGFIRW